MKRNQSGFSVVEVIMAIVIVGLLGAVGWLYWSNVVNKDTDTKPVSATKTITKKTQQADVAKIRTYTSKGLGVAFDYPSTWSLVPQGKSKYDVSMGGEQLDVKSPGGFKMLFSALTADGLGGVGGCDTIASNVVYEGSPRIEGTYVVSYNSNLGNSASPEKTKFHLYLTRYASLHNGNDNCLPMYDNLIDIKKTTAGNDGPTQLGFGNIAVGNDWITSVTKPSDKEYKEAVEILKSLRKV